MSGAWSGSISGAWHASKPATPRTAPSAQKTEHVRCMVRFYIRRLTCTKNSSLKKQCMSGAMSGAKSGAWHASFNASLLQQEQLPDSTNPTHIKCTDRLNVRCLTCLLQPYFWINILTNLHLNPKVKHHSRDLITIIALQRFLLSRINIE